VSYSAEPFALFADRLASNKVPQLYVALLTSDGHLGIVLRKGNYPNGVLAVGGNLEAYLLSRRVVDVNRIVPVGAKELS
jgi:hypothetical protein